MNLISVHSTVSSTVSSTPGAALSAYIPCSVFARIPSSHPRFSALLGAPIGVGHKLNVGLLLLDDHGTTGLAEILERVEKIRDLLARAEV